MARKAAWIFGGVVAVIVVAGISGGGEDTSSDASSKPSVEQSAEVKPSKKEEAVKETPVEKSQTEQFKEFVNKNGTPAEKAAVKHVTKVQGADKFNDILDTASIYTDFKGDFVSDDAPTGKLLASAFADWKESDNGLVTVYNVKGEMLSNGNF